MFISPIQIAHECISFIHHAIWTMLLFDAWQGMAGINTLYKPNHQVAGRPCNKHIINYLSICSRSQTANLPPHREHLTSPGIPHLRHGTVHIHLGHQQTLRPGHISGLADTAVPWLVVFGHPGQKEYELLGDHHPKLGEIVQGKDYRTERYWNGKKHPNGSMEKFP